MDPVTSTAAQAASTIADKAMQEGKGWFSSLLSSPFDLIKGAFEGIFKGLGGAGKGLITGTLGNPMGLLTTGGVLFGLINFAPSLVKFVSDKIGPVKGGKSLAEIYVDDLKEGGMPKALMDVGLAAVALNGVVGVASGTISNAVDSSTGTDKSLAEKAGGALSSAAIIGGLGFLAFTTISSTKVGSTAIGAAQPTDSGTKTPQPTPSAVSGKATPPILTP